MPLRKFSLLCGLVLVLVALGMLVALLAMFISVDIGGDVPTAVITSRLPLPPLLTDAEKAKAVQIIREADVVNTITGDQEWEVAGIVETYIAGSAKAASTKISWSEPVASTGPWLLVRCWGTRQVQVRQLLSNVKHLAVDIDLTGREVVGFGAVHAPFRGYTRPEPNNRSGDDEPSLRSRRIDAVKVGPIGPGTLATIKDFRTQDTLFQGTLQELPRGAGLCAPDEVDDGLSSSFLAYGDNEWESRSVDYSDPS